jgi:hypothetical protein
MTVSMVEHDTEDLVRYLDAIFASGVLNKLLPAINAAKNNMLNVFIILWFKRKEISENIFPQQTLQGFYYPDIILLSFLYAQISMPDLKFVYIFSAYK